LKTQKNYFRDLFFDPPTPRWTSVCFLFGTNFVSCWPPILLAPSARVEGCGARPERLLEAAEMVGKEDTAPTSKLG
jgi:hypothetical protein